MSVRLSEQEIIDKADRLPAFPAVVNDILATLDDDNATLGSLTQFVERDPVITARILSLASSAANAGHATRQLRDLHVAVSLIGLSNVREIVVGVSLAEFARESRMAAYFWEHSVAVGVGAQELARHARQPADFALVAGLLHDIGQLWLSHFYPLVFKSVREAVARGADIVEAERQHFVMDHCQIGALLATRWHLPNTVVEAIRHHHDLGNSTEDKVVAATHVAEVLSHALELTALSDPRVTRLSEGACHLLGIDFQEDLSYLFGKIQARTEYACRTFR